MIESRRNHVSSIIGKSLIIHGGINDYGRYLDDMWELNISINNIQQFVKIFLRCDEMVKMSTKRT